MLTQKLAKFLYQFQYDDIPREAVARAKMHIFDTIGVTLAGSRQPVGKKIRAHVQVLGGKPVATVLGAGFKTSQPLAALANGTMAHALDFDDDSDTVFSHPSSTLVPTILALGEADASGKDILTAFILGHEFSARLARAPGLLPRHYERGWHATSTLGIMGATAAAAKILKLDVTQICHAIGIAASEASGIRANFGFMTKPFHAGSAASKAVSAAMLAGSGFESNPGVLESQSGFLDLFGGDLIGDFSPVISVPGKNWDILWPGINIKRYPCCAYTHAAIDLLLEIMETHDIHSENIMSIQCSISSLAGRILLEEMPENDLGAKFYLPYCLAVAARHGEVSIRHFESISEIFPETGILSEPFPETGTLSETFSETGTLTETFSETETLFGTFDLKNPEMERLLACIQINKDPELDNDGLGLGAALSITTIDNETFSMHREKSIGSGKNPLNWGQLGFKFRSCVNGMIDEKKVLSITSAVNLMEHCNRIDELLDLLAT